MKQYFNQGVAAVLFCSALFFFYQCVRFLARRDYVAAVLLTIIGIAVVRVGAEITRLALLDR